ncbi:hypothetical protein [Cesiribacter sp. SM1]|uniref:hypothetical protein n=1 Tax=Cesiribacter sp. SM1 TaxID=2861196 RepID=UPI001CD7C9CD|nr:hypothetical protein [Cesiribacter sp. SM1]
MPRKINYTFIFLLLIIGTVLFIMWSSLSQPGVKDLEGDFREEALYRNENNTGPIVRLYAVSLRDTLWQEMKQYGDFMPYTKYGTTKVYFFPNNSPVPNTIKPGAESIDDRYKPYCLAVYEKNNMGQVSFIRYPFQ